MKKYTSILLSIILLFSVIAISAHASEPVISVTKSEVTVTGAPDDSDLIVALYQGQQMKGLKVYHGSDTIYGEYADDMAEELKESDTIKAFLWDLSELTPIIPCFSSLINELQESQEENPERALVVYFSCTGNTQTLAEKIHNISGGDIARIIPSDPYTSADLNYNDPDSRANIEINSDSRPDIESITYNVEQYDVILLGYPIWWGQCPPPVRTFLQNNDLSGKIIIPFCTSGSTGISGSLSKIRELCPDSSVTNGFRGTASSTDSQIRSWLDNNNFYESIMTRVKLRTANGNVIIKLNNSVAAKNLAEMLPMSLDFSDFNNTEKIAYPPKDIVFSDLESGTAPMTGDLTLYAPWGNLALFYRDWSYLNDLVPLGSIESGAEYVEFLEGTIYAEIY